MAVQNNQVSISWTSGDEKKKNAWIKEKKITLLTERNRKNGNCP